MEIHSKEPAAQTDLSKVTYTPDKVEAPHVAGTLLKLCTWFIESGFIGPAVISFIKHKNNFTKILENTIVPEKPMFFPEFPCQDTEQCVKYVENTTPPVLRVALATECLSSYDSLKRWGENLRNSFLYWTIRDYAHAYRSGLTTPSLVAESMISIINESERRKPAMKFFIDFNATEVRKQAAQATQRFQEGNPLSILDGIFMPIKDDIDCYPYPSRGGTTWFHEIREVKCDSELVSRLHNCGVILLGKANMHEFGMGVTGNNPHHGTVRNPHSTDCYTGGSSSGPAAIVASGLCPASVGTDGGGSVRIPSALCGVVGLKPTYGRTDMKGTLCEGGTVEVVGPLAATVEDLLLVYAAMSGSSETDMSRLRPMPPCYPYLRSSDSYDLLGKIQLGKYSDWFNDVYAHEIIESSERILTLLHEQYGTETKEIVLPELEESRTAHLVSIGTEALNNCYTFLKEGKLQKLSYDVRINMALFKSFSGANYLSAQCIRRRIMHYYMEAFKYVDVIVTPTTAMTAPKIPTSSLPVGETDLKTSGHLMRFIVAPNLIGLPAVTVPVGYDKKGLPIGLQLIGKPWHEATLLLLASAIEDLAECHKRPEVFYDVLAVSGKTTHIC